MDRQQIFHHLRHNPSISVLIIGAGINGIGTFRDLALQGIDVLIVDKGDFCSGASAASSHMVHGGIRYLENGEFRLVREAVQERNRLIENAPHYVTPLPTVIPIFKWFSGLFNAPLKFLGWLDKPSERGMIVIKAGLMMYDAYTGEQGTVPGHEFRFKRESLGKYPYLNPEVICTARYYDGSMTSPERICIDLLLDGEAASTQARALNYTSVNGASADTVILNDQLTGDTIKVQPKIVINAAGSWIDFTNQRMGYDTRMIGGTKGSHLILDHPQLRTAIQDNEFFFENNDGRLVLLFPLLDKVIVGTSDIPIENPETARCTEEEVDYFLEMIRIVFPGITVDRTHIIYRFSGVRPLPASDAATTGQISRDHRIEVLDPDEVVHFPIYNLIGGKWTSFRAFSEQATDKTLAYLHHTRQISTRDLAIGGGRDYPYTDAAQQGWIDSISVKTGCEKERINILFKRYGTRAAEIARAICGRDDALLRNLPGYSWEEIKFIVREEKVLHLDDFLLRRSNLAKLGQVSRECLDEITDCIAEELNWSDQRKQEEIQRFQEILLDHHGVSI